MGKYVVRRLVAFVPTILLLVLLIVTLLRLLPGDAVDVIMSESFTADTQSREEVRRSLGLDQSIPEVYVSVVAGLVQGDLGTSLFSERKVTDLVVAPLIVSLELMGMALALSIVIGIPLGVLSAIKRNSFPDYLLRSVSIFGLSIPNFAIATGLMVFPTLWWGWSPPLIYTNASEDLVAHLSQFIAPAFVMALASSATVMRYTRTAVLEVLGLDYVRTARAKGLDGRTVIVRHVLRNALIPVVTVIGIQVVFLISGTIIIENIFPIPGMGRMILSAVGQRDYPLVQGITILIGVMVISLNLLIDLAYSAMDPRISLD